MKEIIKAVKAHPVWTGWLAVSILYAVGTSLESGIAAGCFKLGGMILFGIFVTILGSD